jgi:hypothetical protein
MKPHPDFNPYQPPTSPGAPTPPLAALGELVRAWEKLRLLYNGIMLLPGIGVLILWVTRAKLPVAGALTFGVLVGISANVAFFLGPLAELYLRALFWHGDEIGKGRQFIFFAGLLVSAGVVLVSSIFPVFWPQH